MQTANERGKYVTDGKMVYPYNAFLDEMIARGALHWCERPTNVKDSPRPVFRSPITYSPEERLEMAKKLNITLGELTNMSPQEFEIAMAQIEGGDLPKPDAKTETKDGFPA